MNDTHSAQPNIQTIQSQKRKSDESNVDNIENEQNRKKRKLNEEAHQFNKLMESHKLLQKQNGSLIQQNNELTKKTLHYKEDINMYKNEANEWKLKYNELYSQLSIIFMKHSTSLQSDNCDNQFDEYCKHKIIHKKNAHNNTNTNSKYLSDKQDNLSDGYVYEETDSVNTNNEQYVEFENSYYISINCHICDAHFQCMFTYKTHLKQHYDNDNDKTWMICNFDECNKKRLRDSVKFIGHLATHFDCRPYKCNVKNNGIECTVSYRYKHDMKNHWKSHFKLTNNV
eukprot:386156_1